jgi:hypothetical protein
MSSSRVALPDISSSIRSPNGSTRPGLDPIGSTSSVGSCDRRFLDLAGRNEDISAKIYRYAYRRCDSYIKG